MVFKRLKGVLLLAIYVITKPMWSRSVRSAQQRKNENKTFPNASFCLADCGNMGLCCMYWRGRGDTQSNPVCRINIIASFIFSRQ